ncbi:MAG TPA: SDR family NAD(P)-dependent oxidoreductase, partial [Candidatus Baltobacteraceae bacterium]|nr:SDR family NAD(P)-dependent oxidoreductase [Candidatus Baltobacteraceae bacterium]
MIDFTGKTTLITGGGAGIGRAIAEAFGNAGANVVIAEIDAQRAGQIETALRTANVNALVSITDVRDSTQVAVLMQAVEKRFGGLDVLVNNVGDFLRIVKPFEYLSDAEIDSLYAVNLQSVFIVTR